MFSYINLKNIRRPLNLPSVWFGFPDSPLQKGENLEKSLPKILSFMPVLQENLRTTVGGKSIRNLIDSLKPKLANLTRIS